VIDAGAKWFEVLLMAAEAREIVVDDGELRSI